MLLVRMKKNKDKQKYLTTEYLWWLKKIVSAELLAYKM